VAKKLFTAGKGVIRNRIWYRSFLKK